MERRKKQAHGNALYPWDDWFRKGNFSLTGRRRIDTLIQQVRNAAFKRGKRVSVRVEGQVILVRVLPCRS